MVCSSNDSTSSTAVRAAPWLSCGNLCYSPGFIWLSSGQTRELNGNIIRSFGGINLSQPPAPTSCDFLKKFNILARWGWEQFQRLLLGVPHYDCSDLQAKDSVLRLL